MSKKYAWTIVSFIAGAFMPFVVHAAENEVQNLIQSYGFEFRPKQEIPWGIPIQHPEKMVWFKEGDGEIAYKIHSEQSLSEQQLRPFMLKHLKKFARKEIELMARVLLHIPADYAANLDKVSPMEYETELEKTPVHMYRAYLPALNVGGKTYDVICNFKFIENRKSYFLIYAQRGPYQSYDHDVEPHCIF